ncbi:hypothetical protein KIW84_014864 [Lathyrus oleraceus]|uniref:Uncharacterized protein n=1 Tax=Pisum sativum TaxID=3888 RepID=A0A9D5BNR4_PEA|nr:hypothetical protein KIW84_014864 [Pisum sativum]
MALIIACDASYLGSSDVCLDFLKEDYGGELTSTSGSDNDVAGSSATIPRKQKKIQWFWNFGQNIVDVISEKVGGAAEAMKSANSNSNQSNSSSPPASPIVNGHCSSVSYRGDSIDQNVMGILKNIGNHYHQ